MKCPHCLHHFHEQYRETGVEGSGGAWYLRLAICAGCQGDVLFVRSLSGGWFRVWPKGANRPLPSDVPEPFRSDFGEAAVVLPDSPKASAALSRRCLQNVLRENLGIKKHDLSQEIDEVLKQRILPPSVAADLDAVRAAGNFAAHPIKSAATGEITDVEPGEAEWLLDVLEAMFEVLFVEPKKSAARREALNQKLAAAGKPLLKLAPPPPPVEGGT